jgi:Flp pilus assembly protein TadB
MPVEIQALAVLATAAFAWWFWRRVRTRDHCRTRLDSLLSTEGQSNDLPRYRARRFPRRFRWIPPAAGGLALVSLLTLTKLPDPFAVAIPVMIVVLGMIGEAAWANRKIIQMETQLAEAIDLMVGSLRAGSALLYSLENALGEAREPFKSELRELIGRIRLGVNPQVAVREMAARVPLETFRLFSLCLSVHWETGGGLAPTLMTVGRTIRDRVEMSRRIRAQAIEVHLSVIGVAVVAYAIGIIMYRANPDSLLSFLSSTVGSFIASAAIVLQAVGMLWISRMSRVRY